MTDDAAEEIKARALEWHIRLRDGDDDLWDSFSLWLAEDARHVAAYDRVERLDNSLEAFLPDLVFREAANDVGEADVGEAEVAGRGWGKRFWAGGALAASIAAAILIGPQLVPSRYDVVTGPGMRQTVALDPETRVTLNGSTRMTFDRRDSRFASLAEGEALFQVRHDGAKPFRLEVGGNEIENAGTVFNVVRDDDEVRVAVARGRIIYNPRSAAVALGAGDQLLDRVDARPVLTRVLPEAVGSWETGRLVYADAALSQVAADIGRTLGVPVSVAPVLADRAFSGTIVLDGTGSRQFARLGSALDVDFASEGTVWVMKPAK